MKYIYNTINSKHCQKIISMIVLMLIVVVGISLNMGCFGNIAAIYKKEIYMPLAPLELDAYAKQFIPVNDKAVIYISRNVKAAFQKIPIAINENTITSIVAKTFIRIEVDPGLYEISAKTNNKYCLPLRVEAGKINFIGLYTSIGLRLPRCSLIILSDNKGRVEVSKCKLLLGLMP